MVCSSNSRCNSNDRLLCKFTNVFVTHRIVRKMSNVSMKSISYLKAEVDVFSPMWSDDLLSCNSTAEHALKLYLVIIYNFLQYIQKYFNYINIVTIVYSVYVWQVWITYLTVVRSTLNPSMCVYLSVRQSVCLTWFLCQPDDISELVIYECCNKCQND